jgi:hypothetical protein
MNTTRERNEDAVDRIHAEMRRHRAACGCEVGSVFAMVTLVGFVAYLLSGHAGEWTALGTFGRGFAWVVAMSVVGKCVGLGHARLRLVRLGRELESYRPGTHTITPLPLSRTE